MAYKMKEEDCHRCENELTFSIPREFCELYDQIPGPTMSSIIESKPNSIVSIFDINRSYARWKKKVVVSDFLQGFDHREKMRQVRDQKNHSLSAEMIKFTRSILLSTSWTTLVRQMPLGKTRRTLAIREGCRKAPPPVYTPPQPEYPPHVYIASRKSLRLEEAMEKLAFHPIGAALALFSPDYQTIKGGIYRGPMYRESKFEGLHAVSLYRVGMEEGEAIGYVKSSHGELIGEKGCLKVSLQVLMVEVPQNGVEAKRPFKKPNRLLGSFCYPELLPREVGV